MELTRTYLAELILAKLIANKEELKKNLISQEELILVLLIIYCQMM